jgi:hypothetical protein
MTRPHRIVPVSLALLLTAAPALAQEPAAPPSDLTPEAQLHNSRGMTAFLAHDLETALSELQQAYAALPDPVVHRAGRDLVLSSLRGVHLERYDRSHDRVDLCAARELQRAHVAALRAALGPQAPPDAVSGPQKGLAELDARVARDFPDAPCDPPAPATRQSAPSPVAIGPRTTPAPLHPPADAPRPRRLRAVSGTLLGVAGLAAVGSVVAAAFYGDRYRRLDALERQLMPVPFDDAADLHHQARVARTASIALGVGSGLLLVTGVAVLVSAPRRSRQISLTPSATPTSWGLRLHGRF